MKKSAQHLERGATSFLVLLFLLLIAMTTITGVKSRLHYEQVATNLAFGQLTFNGAQTGLALVLKAIANDPQILAELALQPPGDTLVFCLAESLQLLGGSCPPNTRFNSNLGLVVQAETWPLGHSSSTNVGGLTLLLHHYATRIEASLVGAPQFTSRHLQYWRAPEVSFFDTPHWRGIEKTAWYQEK